MDVVMIGWIAIGWFALALVVSLALGGFLRQADASLGEDDLALAAPKHKVLQYLRSRSVKSMNTRGKLGDPKIREFDEQVASSTG